METLGAERFVEFGLGNNKDADGPEIGYKIWEPKLWKALGIDNTEIDEAEQEPITNEHIKRPPGIFGGPSSRVLSTTPVVHSPQVPKSHGIYQQDDHDIRDERQSQGVELSMCS